MKNNTDKTLQLLIEKVSSDYPFAVGLESLKNSCRALATNSEILDCKNILKKDRTRIFTSTFLKSLAFTELNIQLILDGYGKPIKDEYETIKTEIINKRAAELGLK